MIIRQDKTFETCSLYPNSDWYDEGNYVIDETKEENYELIEKIKTHAPYMELVIEEGEIIDIIPTERPEPEPIVPEPTLEEKINLQIAQNSAETLEVIATLNEMQKVEQAQSNAEMIELILSLQGGM